MLKACSYCGTIHSKRYICAPKQAAISLRQRKHADDKITRFRNSATWQEARRQALERDMFLCRVCADEHCLCSDGLQVHHITYQRLGHEDVYNDLVSLCAGCHKKIHSYYRRKRHGYEH